MTFRTGKAIVPPLLALFQGGESFEGLGNHDGGAGEGLVCCRLRTNPFHFLDRNSIKGAARTKHKRKNVALAFCGNHYTCLGRNSTKQKGAATSFFFGTFFFAEKKKVHPLALINHLYHPSRSTKKTSGLVRTRVR